MPPLPNARHENIANALADGMTMTAACAANGGGEKVYGPVATRIRARVEEIHAERTAFILTQGASAVSRALKTREDLWNVIQALVKDSWEKGEMSVAMRGLELLGKDIGMFVQRIQSTQEVTITQLGDDSTVRDELDDIFGSAVRPADDADGSGGVVQKPDPGGAETRH